MNCKITAETIHSLAAGEINGKEKETLLSHIAACPDCAAELAFARQTYSALSALKPVNPPAGFAKAVLAAYAAEKEAAVSPLKIAEAGLAGVLALANCALAAAVYFGFSAGKAFYWARTTLDSFKSALAPIEHILRVAKTTLPAGELIHVAVIGIAVIALAYAAAGIKLYSDFKKSHC